MNQHTHLDEDRALASAIRRVFSAYRVSRRELQPERERQRTTSRLRRLALAAAAPITVAVVVVFVMQSLAAPPAAFAGWTAVPAAPDPAVAAIVENDCRQFLPETAEMSDERMFNEEQRRRIEFGPSPASLPLVAHDRRGEVTLALFTDGHLYADCTIQTSERGYIAIGIGWIEDEPDRAVRVVGGVRGEGSADVPPMHSVIGQVAPSVTRVVIERSEGEPVTATVADGYFLAWWPSAAEIVRITAYDEAGDIVGTN